MIEYVVSLNKDVDYDQFWSEMESHTNGLLFVPDRRVDIVNNRDGSLRSCHYSLTEEEANILRQDPRVYCVEIPADQRKDIRIGLHTTTTQVGNFNKTTSQSGNYVNWGLLRHSRNTNIYGLSPTTTLSYVYDFDGTGVDIVAHDSGLQVNHPEFTDNAGVSRVQQINWYTASGLSGTQSVYHYRDYDGHGTHVAGIIAGKNYGWAKNARIYSLKVSGLEGAGDSGNGIPIADCFDVVKLWHRNKPVDPSTGFKRPTVVNMSWGYSTSYENITGGNYRGTPWYGFLPDASKGMIGTRGCPVRVSSIDVDVQEMIDEGIIVCMAAGNDSHKADVVGGIDYNNYWTSADYGDIYYHQGMSPYSADGIKVGALDSTCYSSTTEQKATYSNAGPGVDIFAAGTNIMSSCSVVNGHGGVPYYWNSTHNQMNISGTSMASPNVAGMAALYLQQHPSHTPAQVKSALTSSALDQIYKTGNNNDYTNFRSILGSTAKVSYIQTSSTVSTPVTPPAGGLTASIVLTGRYLKIGVSGEDFSLGMGSNTKPGIQYDPTGSGYFPGTIDYLTPGLPREGWSVKSDSASISTNKNDTYYSPDISGSYINYSNVSFRGELFDHRLLWTGTKAGKFFVEHDLRFNDDSETIEFLVTLKNISSSTMTNVKYCRFIDPDAGADVGGSYSTQNTRGYPLYGISPKNVVMALASYAGNSLYLGLFTPHATNVNTGITSWAVDPDFYLNDTDLGNGDNNIGVGFVKPSLNANESVTWKFLYFTTPDALNLKTLLEKPVYNMFTGTGGSSTATFALR